MNHKLLKSLNSIFGRALSDEMMALFEKARAEIKASRYTIELRGPLDVWKACADTREKSLIQAYDNHFTPGDGTLPPRSKARPVINKPLAAAEDEDG